MPRITRAFRGTRRRLSAHRIGLRVAPTEEPTNHIARVELAKPYEHDTRIFADSERLRAEAIGCLETRAARGRATESEAARLPAFPRRLERIQKLLARRSGSSSRDP